MCQNIIKNILKNINPLFIFSITAIAFIFNPIFGYRYWLWVNSDLYFDGLVVFSVLAVICLISSLYYHYRVRNLKSILLLGFSIGVIIIDLLYWQIMFTTGWFTN
jgi:hypothetical protein